MDFITLKKLEKNSRWILFLTNVGIYEVPTLKKRMEVYTTYRGDYGRIPATEENIHKIETLVTAQTVK